jgi:cytochrome c oxidase assembly factor CtaG
MVQHELLMVVAAPLLCLGRPLVAWLWLLPSGGRGAVVRATRSRAWAAPWRALTGAAAAWTIHAVVLWGWHLPRFFEAALLDDGWHTLQHFAFLGSALLFWWPVLRPGTGERIGPVLPYLFTTMLHTGALGALLAMSPQAWYPTYAERAPALGFDALEDQQLGGLVMWVPAGLAYVAAGLALAARWIGFREEGGRAGADAPNA